MILDGRSAIMTGAARGIGFAIAGSLASAGAKVCLSDLSAEAAEEAAGRIEVELGFFEQLGYDVEAVLSFIGSKPPSFFDKIKVEE